MAFKDAILAGHGTWKASPWGARVGVRVRGVMLVVGAVLACVGLCVPARAVDAVDWRIDGMGVRDAWASGVTGEGVTVAVIDDQVVEDHPSLAGADVEYRFVAQGGDTSCRGAQDSSLTMSKEHMTVSTADGFYVTHATHMVGLIAGTGAGYDGGLGFQGIAPGAHVIAYPTELSEDGPIGGFAPANMACVIDKNDSINPLVNGALADAVDSGARVVNMSFIFAVPDSTYIPVMLHALRHGVVMVSARDNSTIAGMYDLVGVPGTNNYSPGTVTVNSADRDGNLSVISDVMDGNVSVLSPGVGVPIQEHGKTSDRTLIFNEGGTSSAAADLSGYLALVFQKWPGATGNQVLQSLVRNTRGNTTGEPVLDPEHKRGFGMVDPARLLATDPTVYPDVNPLLEWAVKASDRHEETRGMYGEWKDGTSGESDPFSPEGDKIRCTSLCGAIGDEYRRQARAWAKVEECRKDGGEDCMRYSATATADKADKDAGWVSDGSASKKSSGDPSVPGWVVPVVAGGAVVAGGVVLAVVLARRRRRARTGGPAAVGMGPAPQSPAGVRPVPGVPPAGVGPGRPCPQPSISATPVQPAVLQGAPAPTSQPPVPAPRQPAQPQRSSTSATGTQASIPQPPTPGAMGRQPALPRRQ